MAFFIYLTSAYAETNRIPFDLPEAETELVAGYHTEYSAMKFAMGVDGISMWLILLTTFLTPLCVLISWTSVHDRVKEFFILLLILETALIGVFTALDLFLFYFFWESTLIPMALLIGMYGHGRKIYAAVKFFLYTMPTSGRLTQPAQSASVKLSPAR